MKHLAILLTLLLFTSPCFAGQLTLSDGGFLLTREISPATFDPSASFPISDINTDGVDDILMAHGAGGVLSAMSASDGSILWQLDYGSSEPFSDITIMGDVSGDGKGDLLLNIKTGHCPTYLNEVVILDVVTGASIHSWAMPQLIAVNVFEMGDVDLDGINDIGISQDSSGEVNVYSTNSAGSIVWSYTASNNNSISLISEIDTNQDGMEDIILGIPGHDSSGYVDNGQLIYLDGRNGNVLSYIEGQADYDQLGHYIAAAPDMNGDAIEDVFSLNGSGYAFSSADCQLISGGLAMNTLWSTPIRFC